MEQLPIVRPGERVVARSDGKGGMVVSVEKIEGRCFAVSAQCTGYVLDARLLWDVLGSLKMDGVPPGGVAAISALPLVMGRPSRNSPSREAR
ncbi:hypothetical protein ACWD42_43370, partial [Streptomyces sp. NPDC002550]